MKISTTRSLAGALLILAAALSGCGDDRTDPLAAAGIGGGGASVPVGAGGPGCLHNRFLEEAFRQLASAGREASAEPAMILAAERAANAILAEAGLPVLTRQEVVRHIDRGRELARRTLARLDEGSVIDLAQGAFAAAQTGERDGAVAAFARYVAVRADAGGALEARRRIAREGSPLNGPEYSIFMDILVQSDVFWSGRHPDATAAADKSWKKFLKFVTLTAIDAGSGLVAGAGYGAVGGPGGSAVGGVVGAVVGGLSSWGANDVIYN